MVEPLGYEELVPFVLYRGRNTHGAQLFYSAEGAGDRYFLIQLKRGYVSANGVYRHIRNVAKAMGQGRLELPEGASLTHSTELEHALSGFGKEGLQKLNRGDKEFFQSIEAMLGDMLGEEVTRPLKSKPKNAKFEDGDRLPYFIALDFGWIPMAKEGDDKGKMPQDLPQSQRAYKHWEGRGLEEICHALFRVEGYNILTDPNALIPLSRRVKPSEHYDSDKVFRGIISFMQSFGILSEFNAIPLSTQEFISKYATEAMQRLEEHSVVSAVRQQREAQASQIKRADSGQGGRIIVPRTRQEAPGAQSLGRGVPHILGQQVPSRLGQPAPPRVSLDPNEPIPPPQYFPLPDQPLPDWMRASAEQPITTSLAPTPLPTPGNITEQPMASHITSPDETLPTPRHLTTLDEPIHKRPSPRQSKLLVPD